MHKLKVEKSLNIGLIGAGWIGRAYAQAFRNLKGRHALNPKLHSVATSNLETAKLAAKNLDFEYFTDNWKHLCENSDIDLICIASPIHLHKEQAILALENKKHIALEKPLAVNLQEVQEIQEAVQKANKKVSIGYNYLHNPMIYKAKEIIQNGLLGDIINFRVCHIEDFLSDSKAKFNLSHVYKKFGANGIINDLGSHGLSMINYLLGNVIEVNAISQRVYKRRGKDQIEMENDDQFDSILLLENKLQGTLTCSWMGTGRGMNLGFEIYGTKGSLHFNQERLNELDVYLVDQNKLDMKGGLTIRASKSHNGFSLVCPGDEHGIGFMDLKTLEIYDFLNSILHNQNMITDFKLGFEIEKQIDALIKSKELKSWVKV